MCSLVLLYISWFPEETSTTGSTASVYTEHKVYLSLFKWSDTKTPETSLNQWMYWCQKELVYWSHCQTLWHFIMDINTTFISRSYPAGDYYTISNVHVWNKPFITSLCLSVVSSWRKWTVTKTVLSRRRSWRFGSKMLRRNTFTTAWSISGKTLTRTTTVWSAGRSTRTSRTGVTWVNTKTQFLMSQIHLEILIDFLNQ